jgi:hypothetical protein
MAEERGPKSGLAGKPSRLTRATVTQLLDLLKLSSHPRLRWRLADEPERTHVTSPPEEKMKGSSVPGTGKPQPFEIRQTSPSDEEIVESWNREIADPRVRQYHGVEAYKTRDEKWPWNVSVWVMEFARDPPLEPALRTRIAVALKGVEGVVDVVEGDRELWLVRGTPSGRALADAVAPIVDEFAPEMKAYVEANIKK